MHDVQVCWRSYATFFCSREQVFLGQEGLVTNCHPGWQQFTDDLNAAVKHLGPRGLGFYWYTATWAETFRDDTGQISARPQHDVFGRPKVVEFVFEEMLHISPLYFDTVYIKEKIRSLQISCGNFLRSRISLQISSHLDITIHWWPWPSAMGFSDRT